MTKHKCTWQLSEDGAAICLECTTIIGADGLIESLQTENTKLKEEIAALETSLAERWENLNVQDGVIDGLKEEITRLNEYIAEMVRMAAAKHRPAYDEQQKIIMGLQEEIAALRVIARSAAQEEETKLDENQFITQQSRIVKLAALREAGYLKEEG